MDTLYDLPPTLPDDLDRFKEETQRYKSGETNATQFRSFRVPQGVYEQRQNGTFMLRVRLPGGAMLPHQMRKLASVASTYGSGLLHVTTRQDIQVHDVTIDNIHPALVDLYSAGLSSKGGGGNTLRNITACADAGVCPLETFDVTPHANALTELMLRDPVSFQLPRKYKITFSGCSTDCMGVMINDVGFVAKEGPDGPGFAVYAGGGMGAQSRVGQLLEEFVPVGDTYLIAEAIKRVFDKHGNRKNKQKARLRFLVEDKGFDGFRNLYREELAQLRAEGPTTPELREPREFTPHEPAPAAEPMEGFDRWRKMNVAAQKQPGYFMVHVPRFLGEFSADTIESLAQVADEFGEGVVRATPSQNLVMRWVTETELPGLHRALTELDLAASDSPAQREMIACTGANTCRLGICLSQGLAEAVSGELRKADIDLDDAVDLKLHINGCPNACGRQPIASLGFYGTARRVNGRLAPHYVMQVGGRVGEGTTRLAEGKEVVPARSIPAFVTEYLRAFRESKHYPDFDAFLENGGRDLAVTTAEKHQDVPPFTEDRNYYYDWSAEEPFSLAGRGAGECSAGVFDLIKVDLTSARAAMDSGKLGSAIELASRALLITRGEEAKDAPDALRLFEEHFVKTELVDGTIGQLIADARKVVAKPCWEAFDADPGEVASLVTAVEELYANMDQSLRFKAVASSKACVPVAPAAGDAPSPAPAKASSDVTVDREADLAGVTCPLNYVKTKMMLNQMQQGQVLAVMLDEAGGKSVPRSAEKDGHEVLSEEQQGNRFRVVIRKA